MASASGGGTEVIVGEQGWQPGRKTEHEMGESEDKSEPTSCLSPPPAKTLWVTYRRSLVSFTTELHVLLVQDSLKLKIWGPGSAVGLPTAPCQRGEPAE